MKKSIIVICSVISCASLAAFGLSNWKSWSTPCHTVSNDTIQSIDTLSNTHPISFNIDNFNYDLGNRFRTTIKLNDLRKSTSLIDVLPPEVTEQRFNYTNVKVAQHPDLDEKFAFSNDENFTSEQLELIASFNNSSNFYINANFLYKQPLSMPLNDDFLVYYISVVPEVETEYLDGNDNLVSYIKERTKEDIAFVNQRDLRSGTITLEINESGILENLNLTSTSGYDYIDMKMMQLLNSLPYAWKPAKDSNGNAVKQELVFSFGQMGC